MARALRRRVAESDFDKERQMMKILVAYDGSACAEAAIDDLVHAGLPDAGQALVLAVAEVWLPPAQNKNVTGIKLDARTERMIRNHWIRAENAVADAQELANRAKERLRGIVPDWEIAAEATYGSPAWEIITRAARYKPDLIVAGSHGRSAISRLFLGSISQKVLTEAHCSVRVARGRVEVDPVPSRIVIGFDDSQGARLAVKAVASRKWRAETEVRLVTATDPIYPSLIEKVIPPTAHLIEEVNEDERKWAQKAAEKAMKTLRKSGLKTSFHINPGNPKRILVEEAENWHADCIFVGANAAGSRLERFLLGSTSASVAAHAHCSVEVVRKARRRNVKAKENQST
jgi:nucleotide-binding universal stress UspA family protein